MRTYRPQRAPRKSAGESVDAYLARFADWADSDSQNVQKAAQADTGGVRFQALSEAPNKTAAGDVVYADGTNYTPVHGAGLHLYDGSTMRQVTPYTGSATLVAGTVTVSLATVTANSRIQLTSQVDGGTPGFLRVSARSVGVSFTITSSNGADTSTVAYSVMEP